VLQHNLRRYGLFGTTRMWLNLILRLTFRRLPPVTLKSAYRLLLHGR
jgi:hypothetical protein